jgi:hypothetical protein
MPGFASGKVADGGWGVDVAGRGRHRAKHEGRADRQPHQGCKAGGKEPVKKRHHDPVDRDPGAKLGKLSQLPRRRHAHFQDEQDKHATEEIDEEGLDPGKVLFAACRADDKAAAKKEEATPAQGLHQDDFKRCPAPVR